MKRRLTADGPNVRGDLIDHYRRLELHYGGVPGCPFGPMADRLESGAAVRVRGRQLGSSLKATGFKVNDNLVIEPDGMVALLFRCHAGDTICFSRADGSEVR